MSAVLDDLASLDELALLASAPSLTSAMAYHAFAEFMFSPEIIDILDNFGFVENVGPEFRLVDDLRWRVMAQQSGGSLWREVNAHYYDRASEGAPGESLPDYLTSGLGLAYHGLEIDTRIGETAYRNVAHIDSLAVSIEAWRLATEQASRGLMQIDNVVLLFLQGMTMYRLGSQAEAISVLRRVANLQEDSREVAVAQHLVGYWDCKRRGGVGGTQSAQGLLKASHKSAAKRQDLWHLAHVKHSMALCMLKSKPQNRDGPIQLLRGSLNLTRELGDRFGEAKVLHSLGQALVRDPATKNEGRRLLEQSLAIGVDLGYLRHQMSVIDSLRKIEPHPRRRADLERKLQSIQDTLPKSGSAC